VREATIHGKGSHDVVRFIVEVMGPTAWVAYTIWITQSRWRLKRLLNGLHDPELCLTRKERRDRARKLLQRRDDEDNQRLIEQTMNYLKGEQLPHEK
jgi:hypothetical protein